MVLIKKLKKLTKKWLNRKGLHLYKEGFMPKGILFESDLRSIIKLSECELIIDIGACQGEMTARFLKTFSNAHVIAVEPATYSFSCLQSKFANNSRVTLQNYGVGSENSLINFRLFDDPQLNTFKPVIQNDEAASVGNTVTQVKTIEEIIKAFSPEIENIDFLKIDVEGFEIECLMGANNLLDQNRIGCILIEAGFIDTDERHTPFGKINHLLKAKNFSFYSLYDLYHYIKRTELRAANALFINETYLLKRKLLKSGL